ncbi:carboxy-S-adenosyl-L-methionine synthase CmoA [Spirochaeta cellobiosiphila]|uniref:carboxy-S-adenosyl-L-methionine synthase CmoA n=1 Tax=Spirochaeta cellobiosiphila TaxID=504483 RepID=UPI0004186B34|nr:carboxy-S-adenosyl-L-methionine synthase CmoA [Spirochaeta cellobiosiphila]
MDKSDCIYDTPLKNVPPFEFNSKVAHVFDDMALRSIPFYSEVQSMIATYGRIFYRQDTAIYDLGCSTGTTLLSLYHSLKDAGHDKFKLIGLDQSAAMCEEAKEKFNKAEVEEASVDIRNEDILTAKIENASVIVLNYTLQFIDPLLREEILKHVYNGLTHNGILLVSDKMLQSSTDISRIFVDYYYAFKRSNGYSDMEISQKREALENVLIPYTVKEEQELFYSCGFNSVDIFFSWNNFTSFICMKK